MLQPNDELRRRIFNEYLSKIGNSAGQVGSYLGKKIAGGFGGSVGGYLGDKLGEKLGLNPSVQPITNFAGSTLGNLATQKAGQILGGLAGGAASTGATAAGTAAATGAGATGAGSLLGASALGGPIGLAVGAGLAGLSYLLNKNEEKKQNRNTALQIQKQAEQEANADLDAAQNKIQSLNPYMPTNGELQQENNLASAPVAQPLTATIQAQPQVQEQVQETPLEDINPWCSLDNEIISKVFDGKDYTQFLPINSGTGELGLKDKILNGINDLQAGYDENLFNKIKYEKGRTERPDESGMYKLGEAFGTANRIAQNPILQGVIAGGAYGLSNKNALYGLGKGVEWATNRSNTNRYRDTLAEEGQYVNPGILGSMNATDYSNYSRRPLREAMTDVYKQRAEGEALENQNAQEMSNLTVGDYLNGAVLSGRFRTQEDMLDWAAANNIDLNAKYYPELQTQLLNEFKEKNKYGANKTAQEKVDLLKQGKPTQITEFRNIKSGGANDTVTHYYPNGNPYQKGGNNGNNNGRNVSQNGTVIINPTTGERMKLINGKWEKI